MDSKNLSIEINLFNLLIIIANLVDRKVTFVTKYIKGANVGDAQQCERCIIKDALSGRIVNCVSSFERENHIGLVIFTNIESFTEFVRLIEDQFRE